MKRKDFIRLSGALGAFLSVPGQSLIELDAIQERLTTTRGNGSAHGLQADAIATVRVGLIGCGNRGQGLIDMFEFLVRDGHAHIAAICDLNPKKTTAAHEQVKRFQEKAPDIVQGDERAWEDLIKRDDIDLVLVCTPWHLHTPMALLAMESGKHVATEVPAAYTLDECWQIIETAERTRRHHIMLENCCYNDEELWLLNMAKEGVFGELTHAECAYIHDLRQLLIDEHYYEDQWRLKEHEQRNGNLYTTHGLGPVSFYLDVGRGDYFRQLVSMSSREVALSAARPLSSGKPYPCGDMNSTLLKTYGGKSVLLQFDTHTGRPYSRINTLAGSKAVHQGYPSRLYIDHGPTWDWHRWLDESEYTAYRERYRHPIWKKMDAQAKQKEAGHGGMDFIMLWRLIRCLNQGIALDINVYDGILWSAVSPLSELSVAQDSAPVQVPDFTSGRWRETQAMEIMRDCC